MTVRQKWWLLGFACMLVFGAIGLCIYAASYDVRMYVAGWKRTYLNDPSVPTYVRWIGDELPFTKTHGEGWVEVIGNIDVRYESFDTPCDSTEACATLIRAACAKGSGAGSAYSRWREDRVVGTSYDLREGTAYPPAPPEWHVTDDAVLFSLTDGESSLDLIVTNSGHQVYLKSWVP